MRLVPMVLLVALAAAPAYAGAPPAPDRLAMIRATLDTSTFVRVTARRGTFEVREAHADSAGLRLVRSRGRTALFMSDDAPTDERRIPWSDVQRVEAGRAASAAPLAFGVGLGILVTSGALLAARDNDSEAVAMAAIWAVPLGIGCALGGLALSLGHSDMYRLYP